MSDADDALWGEAAIYFSLDITDTLAPLLGLSADYAAIKRLNRQSIEANRAEQASQAGRPAVRWMGVGNHVRAAFAPHPRIFERYADFVTHRFVGRTNAHSGQNAAAVGVFAAATLDPAKREAAATALGAGFALNDICRCVSAVQLRKITDAEFAFDEALACEPLSPWDEDMLSRHAPSLGRSNPLAALFQSAVDTEISNAVAQFRVGLGPERDARFMHALGFD